MGEVLVGLKGDPGEDGIDEPVRILCCKGFHYFFSLNKMLSLTQILKLFFFN